MSKPSLSAKLIRVSKAVTGLKKDGYNQHHKYKFVSHDNVVNSVSEALVAEGVDFTPQIISVHREGKSLLVEMSYRFTCTDTGETEECRWLGEGQDSQDKSIYKAVTQAKKTFLLNKFLVATGEQYADGDFGQGYEKPKRRREEPQMPEGWQEETKPAQFSELPRERQQKARAKFFAIAGELVGDAGDTKTEAYKLCADLLGKNDKGETSLTSSTVAQVADAINFLNDRLKAAKKLAAATGLQAKEKEAV